MQGYTDKEEQISNNINQRVIQRESFPHEYLTVNPGDRISPEHQTIEEKSKQMAVDAPDITGDHIKVPTYFIVDYPNGEKKALHHIKDAKEISDVIRQAQLQVDNWDNPPKEGKPTHNINWSVIVLIVGLCGMTIPILLGVF